MLLSFIEILYMYIIVYIKIVKVYNTINIHVYVAYILVYIERI
jgi:hypothetical protein